MTNFYTAKSSIAKTSTLLSLALLLTLTSMSSVIAMMVSH